MRTIRNGRAPADHSPPRPRPLDRDRAGNRWERELTLRTKAPATRPDAARTDPRPLTIESRTEPHLRARRNFSKRAVTVDAYTLYIQQLFLLTTYMC
jgi:hypothetical protein